MAKLGLQVIVGLAFLLIICPILAEERKADAFMPVELPPIQSAPAVQDVGQDHFQKLVDELQQKLIELIELRIRANGWERKHLQPELEERRRDLKELQDPFPGKEHVPPWIL